MSVDVQSITQNKCGCKMDHCGKFWKNSGGVQWWETKLAQDESTVGWWGKKKGHRMEEETSSSVKCKSPPSFLVSNVSTIDVDGHPRKESSKRKHINLLYYKEIPF